MTTQADKPKNSTAATEQELVFHVDNLDCADCAAHLEEAISQMPDVSEVHLDFMRARMRVVPKPGNDISTAIKSQAQAMGHTLQYEEERRQARTQPVSWQDWIRTHRRDVATALSGILIILALAARWLGASHLIETALFSVAIVSGGFYITRAAIATVTATRSLDMNMLMTLAVMGAMAIGEWLEGAMVIFLFSLGETLESYTMNRARNAISTLINLSPKEAIRLHEGHEERVAVEELRIGDLILIPPGERISMDGTIESGHSAVNQAPVTGESVPMDKSPGDAVYAGTVNGQGALTVRVTHLAEDNTISRIIKMVEEAQALRAPAQRFVDVFAKYYTPAIVVAALIVIVFPPLLNLGTWSEWFYRGLVLLVIGCPCALVISTPVSIVAAIASAARSGVIIKGGSYLEELGKVKVMAFDKTGTLTLGKPQVVEARCALHDGPVTSEDCASCRHMLTTAAAIESQSEHPLARAVVEEAKRQGLDWSEEHIEGVEAITGRGVRGKVSGHTITLGSHKFIHESSGDASHSTLLCEAVDKAETGGQTVMVLDCDKCGTQGYIAVADTIRESTPEAIQALKDMGIEKTVMLTGDNAITAGVISRMAGIDEFEANLLPEDKVAAVEKFMARYGKVAMVGDGINDAPALAKASVGIAMGAAGSTTALETADVALMTDNLKQLSFAIRLGRRALSTIQQNIVFALALKAVFLVLAVIGVATLWMAVFADVGASLIVILNGMRLLGVKPKI